MYVIYNIQKHKIGKSCEPVFDKVSDSPVLPQIVLIQQRFSIHPLIFGETDEKRKKRINQ